MRAPDVAPDEVLTPFSRSVLESGGDAGELFAGVAGRVGLIAPAQLVREIGGRYYASWNALDAAREGLSPERLSFGAWGKLLTAAMASPAAGAVPATDDLRALVDAFRSEIRAQQTERFAAEARAALLSRLLGPRRPARRDPARFSDRRRSSARETHAVTGGRRVPRSFGL
ncbi:MAG: hypothetical protein M5R36_13045 [Deltaproteobacteria bacterium]|nr:hypothetical protein [Deltaproteobacteria bacterium]